MHFIEDRKIISIYTSSMIPLTLLEFILHKYELYSNKKPTLKK